MAVIVKYVVVRDGKEDMIFTTKKEADAYDKMLDIAEQLHKFIRTSEIDIAVEQLDDLTFFMAQNRDQVSSILKGSTPESSRKTKPGAAAEVEAPAEVEASAEPVVMAEPSLSDTPKGPTSTKAKAAA